jgi:hypothetical protein
MELGADAFILKPCEPEVFLGQIAATQADTAARVPPRAPVGADVDQLLLYSEALVRKLEDKSLQLERANEPA